VDVGERKFNVGDRVVHYKFLDVLTVRGWTTINTGDNTTMILYAIEIGGVISFAEEDSLSVYDPFYHGYRP
jgi:hypothetical protein